jgi:acetyl esterase
VLSGVPVIYREYRGTIHGFCSYRKLIPSAQADTLAFLALAKAMIAEALAG